MPTDNSINVNDIIDRLKEAEGMSSDADFAKRVDMKPSTLSMARKRNSIDLIQIFTQFEEYSTDWILYGEGPIYKYMVSTEGKAVNYKLIEKADGLTPDDQEELLGDIHTLLNLNLTSEQTAQIIKLYIHLKNLT